MKRLFLWSSILVARSDCTVTAGLSFGHCSQPSAGTASGCVSLTGECCTSGSLFGPAVGSRSLPFCMWHAIRRAWTLSVTAWLARAAQPQRSDWAVRPRSRNNVQPYAIVVRRNPRRTVWLGHFAPRRAQPLHCLDGPRARCHPPMTRVDRDLGPTAAAIRARNRTSFADPCGTKINAQRPRTF